MSYLHTKYNSIRILFQLLIANLLRSRRVCLLVSVSASYAVVHRFTPRMSQTKNHHSKPNGTD